MTDRKPILLAALLLAASAEPAQAQAPTEPDPDEASQQAELQAELDAMLRELHGDWGSEDPFADGRPPDLLVVTSSDVRGEVAPCG